MLRVQTLLCVVALSMGILVTLGVFSPVFPSNLYFTSTPSAMDSILINDTCAPPCWFGLTPGESTAEDARTFFATRDNFVMGPNWGPGAFGPGTAVLEGDESNGTYYFDLQGVDERPDSHLYLASYLIIRDGFVHSIWIWMKAHITLQEVLEALGTPDMIHMSVIDSVRAFNFIYPDALVSVWLKANVNECDISRLGQDFWASSIWYYSPEAAIEPVDRVLIDRLQPALYAYDNPYERDVPLDIWETWLSGEVDLSCEEAVEQLPEEVIYPTVMPTMLGTVSPSLTPTVTPMPSATP